MNAPIRVSITPVAARRERVVAMVMLPTSPMLTPRINIMLSVSPTNLSFSSRDM